MKTVSKKLFSLMLVAVLLISAVPFQAFAAPETCDDSTHTESANFVDLGNGYHCKTCVEDGKAMLGTTSAHIEEATGTVTTPSTCSVKGVKTFLCTECGGVAKKEEVDLDPTAHSWDAGVVTTPATCTVDGVKTFTCSGCTTTKTEPIAATGHSYTITKYDATNHWMACSCGATDTPAAHTLTDYVGADGHGKQCACGYKTVAAHDFKLTTTTAATCTAAGTASKTCSVCNYDGGTVAIAATGHVDKDSDKRCDTCKTYLSSTVEIPVTAVLTLDAKGGTLASNTLNLSKGKAVSTFGKLPTPTKEGYAFGGWYIGSTKIQDGTIVDEAWGATPTATAKWTLKTKQLKITLCFEDGSVIPQDIYVDGVSGEANLLDFLKNNTEVKNQITKALNDHPGYTYQYYYDYSGSQGLIPQDAKMDQAQNVKIIFKAKTFKISFVTEEAGAKITGTNPKTVTFNKAVGDLPTASLNGKIFTGWVDKQHGGKVYSKDTIYKVADDITLTAVFSDSAVVVLHVYTNGNTSTAVLNEVMYGYATQNKITGLYDNVTRADVEKFISGKFVAQSGKTMTVDGLFDAKTWADYVASNCTKSGVPTIAVNDYRDLQEHPLDIYIMLRNVNFGSSSSSNNNSTNPKTGDQVMLEAAASVMALAAAGYVTLTVLRKKQVI